MIRFIYFFAIVGILSAVLAAVLYSLACNWSNVLGSFSTIVSIVLGVVSIIYSYYSGKQLNNTLEEMKRQNRKLVDKINNELSKDNYNENNIEYIRSTIDEQ